MALPENIARLTGLLKGVAVLGGVGLAGYNSFFSVQGGHRAVMFNRVSGVKNEVLGEGLHFKVPWFEWPLNFDIRTRPRELNHTLAGTRDLQYVQISLRVLFAPMIQKLPNTVREYGDDYDRRILPSLMNECLKGVVAQYNAEQLTTQREEVSRMVRRNLTERAQDFNIRVDDCAITSMDFGNEFKAAVESKQVAQQEAERAKYDVERAVQEKKSKIIQAQGESQAALLIGHSMKKNPAYAQLKRIEVAKEISHSIAHSRNRVFLSSDALLVNLMSEFGGSTQDSRNHGGM